MVCLVRKDGTEISYSGEGFDRNTIEAVGSMSKNEAEKHRIENTKSYEAGGVFRAVVDTGKEIAKSIYDTVVRQVNPNATENSEQSSIPRISGTENDDKAEKEAVQKAEQKASAENSTPSSITIADSSSDKNMQGQLDAVNGTKSDDAKINGDNAKSTDTGNDTLTKATKTIAQGVTKAKGTLSQVKETMKMAQNPTGMANKLINR